VDIVTLILIDSHLERDDVDAIPRREPLPIASSPGRATDKRPAGEPANDWLAQATWEDAEWQ
jgi:hypothetical protein